MTPATTLTTTIAPIDRVLPCFAGVTRTGERQWQAKCPAHDDRHASLSISEKTPGGAVGVFCHAKCATIIILRRVGLKWADLFPDGHDDGLPRRLAKHRIVATYDYTDAAGELVFQVVRFDPKSFRQRRPDGNGWTWNLDGIARPLYRLPELIAGEARAWVFVVEGEKDVDRLYAAAQAAGVALAATTCPQGAGKWDKLADDSALVGRRVAIIPDDDEPGRAHARDVHRRLSGRAADVRVLAPLPGGKDVTDWLDAGGTIEALVALADGASDAAPIVAYELGEYDAETGRLVLHPDFTLPTARAYMREFHTHADGFTLRHYAGRFVAWNGSRYVEIEDGAIEARLLPWLDDARKPKYDKDTEDYKLVRFPAHPRTVGAALLSLQDFTYLSNDTTVPSWLTPHAESPADVLACRSMLVHLPTGRRSPPTPALFSTAALDFDPGADDEGEASDGGATGAAGGAGGAGPPKRDPTPRRWLAFLADLYRDDVQALQLTQEWFGYCLTPDTRQQKMLLIVGPKRAGKGTLMRVLSNLVGTGNVAGPTISGLAGEFGFQGCIGKSLAIVGDARFRGDKINTVVERLLLVSGEDLIEINRKGIPPVTVKLPTRFVFLTNELPRFNDAAGALASRLLLIRLTQTFFDREDHGLIDALLGELPGILTWSIEGWHRLRERGRFEQPESAASMLKNIEDLSSPVGAFVRERCRVSPGGRAWVDELYKEWKAWCERDGRTTVSTRQAFGSDLHAAAPTIRARQGTLGRFYEGIELLDGQGLITGE